MPIGPIADMQKTHKQNLKQLKGRKSLKELNQTYSENSGEKPEYVTVSEGKLMDMKLKLQAKRKKERKSKLIWGIVFFASGVSIAIWLLFF